MDKLQVLKKVFGYEAFRDGQETIIDNILSGKDVLGIMPTGAGKSICYQLPALMMKGITIVVSPLISLMADQVKALNEAGVHAAYINSSLTDAQITKALYYAMCGRYKIVYVAPERLETDRFLEFALNSDISMITVDEAHCISQWGQDFRPSYLKIASFVKRFEKRPVVSAFTATATQMVKEDIVCILGLDNPEVMVTGFDRTNLYFEVRNGVPKDATVLDYVQKHPGDCGIIYCATRKNVDKVYAMLNKAGVSVTLYHAGLDIAKRENNQQDFIYERKLVMVATNAFGMGIDKSNVRYVLHYNMPQSIENYYQEAGRAGRDGEPAECVLLYSAQDVMINEFLIDNKGQNSEFTEDEIETIHENDRKRLNSMRFYCTTKNCLRGYMLDYFGEHTHSKECGNCGNCTATFEEKDVTDICIDIIKCVMEMHGRFGVNVVVGTLRGENTAKLRSYNVSRFGSFATHKDLSQALLKNIIDELLLRGYLSESEDIYRLLRTTDISDEVLDGSVNISVKWSEKKEEVRHTRVKSKKARITDILNSNGMALFEMLRTLRLNIAKEENMPPYIIFSDKTLIDMCRKQPFTKAEMLSVSGVGENKYERYGERFISCIIDYTNAEKMDTTYEED